MKHLLLFLTLSFLAHTSFAQQSFSAKGNNAIKIDIPNSNLAVQQAKTEAIMVDIEISVNYPKAVIEQLQKVNRYKVTSKPKDGTLVFTTPNLIQGVTIGGKKLTEKIKINVTTPNGFTSKGNTIFNAKNLKTIEQSVQINVHFVYGKERAAAATQPRQSNPTAPGKSTSKRKIPTATKEVQALYGDIIIGNMPIDDFYD
ncbi:MAG: hypothetical protein JKY03_04755 [Aureispira sp.]|nr:hypothetical protein [Aureispira sp.]